MSSPGPSEISFRDFFLPRPFFCRSEILFVHGNKLFDRSMKQCSHQFSQHDLILLLFIFYGNHFLNNSRKTSLLGPVKAFPVNAVVKII